MAAVYLEDILVGQEGVSSRRTVTETDIVNFCGLAGDFSPLHADEVYIKEETTFRGRIAQGVLVTAIASGLRSELDEWQISAALDSQRAYRAVTYPGDTIQCRWKVIEVKRSSSAPERGIVKLAIEVANQNGEVVQSGIDVLMVSARKPGEE